MRLQTAVLACALGASRVCGTTNYLTWPFSVGGNGYAHQGQLGALGSDSFVMDVPIFPASVPLALFSALTVTVQCTSCHATSCLTVSSSSGCTGHYCDTAVHTCTDVLPYSNAMPTTYTLTLTNKNTLSFAKTYAMSVSQACNTGSVLDENACTPVTVGPYGTYRAACVFVTPHSVDGLMFGINGCSCSTDNSGYSTCWYYGVPQSIAVSNGAQNCAPPICSPPPSPYPTPSQTPSASPTPSNTPTPSHTPSVCPSPVTHTPSPSATVSRTPSLSATVSRTPSPTSTASHTPSPTQPFSLGDLKGSAAVGAVVGIASTGLLAACAAVALVWRWRRQPRPRRAARVDAAIALTARGELAGTGTTAPLLDASVACPACRVENAPSARFCVACGAALTA